MQTVKSQWTEVPDIDLSKFKPADFTDEELDIPYYLKHFHTFANSVTETGPDKGFINIPVWRRSGQQAIQCPYYGEYPFRLHGSIALIAHGIFTMPPCR